MKCPHGCGVELEQMRHTPDRMCCPNPECAGWPPTFKTVELERRIET